MNDLIPISYENDTPTVSGRQLHEFLGVETRYNDWFARMCEYGFSDNTDFYSILSKTNGGRPSTDHALSMDMAKELCMLQRTDRGKELRHYFIQVEKSWNSPEQIMARALQIANNKMSLLKTTNEEQQALLQEQAPKVLFADSVAASKSSVLVGELAKIICQNGVDIGQNRLFSWLRNNGYLCNRKGEMYNLPTQKSMDMKLFEIKKTVVNNPDGSTKTNKTPKVTGKGQVYFVNKFLEKVIA